MIKQAAIACALIAAAPVWAVNKCTGPDGKVSYQEAPCADSHVAKEVKISTSPAATSSMGRQMPLVPVPLDPEVARKIAAADMLIAKNRLKDPDSAKFDGVRVFAFKAMGNTIEMTCGNLNAKNSYGGYVGSKPFWVYEGIFTETFDHYYPKDKSLTYLMGKIQTACLTEGMAI